MSKKQKEDKLVGGLPFYESTKLFDLVAAADQLGLELHVVLSPKSPAATPAPKTKPPKKVPTCPGGRCLYFHRPGPCRCIRDGDDDAPDKCRKQR